MDPRGTVGRIYKEYHYTLLLTKYESSGPRSFGEEVFFVFPIVSRIYKEDHYTLLHTKYESSGPCGFREDFFYVFPMMPRGPAHTCDISLFRRDLPILEQISLFRISEFPYIFYTSPYLEFQISLPKSKNFLLCLIILPIWKGKSPYLASQMYHMYGPAGPEH